MTKDFHVTDATVRGNKHKPRQLNIMCHNTKIKIYMNTTTATCTIYIVA